MSVPLPRRIGGDPNFLSSTRIPLKPETKSILKQVLEYSTPKSNHKEPKKSPRLLSRIQEILRTAATLRQSIERLRANTIKTVEDLRIIQACVRPSDPGITAPNGDFKRNFDMEVESKVPFHSQEEKLQQFNASNWRIISSLFKFEPWSYILPRFDPQSPQNLVVPIKKQCLFHSQVEKKALIMNMSDARKTMRPRFFAVGLFLSVLLVSSRQLIEHMKRVWKIRGELDANPLETDERRKYIINFSKEGYWQHVLRGGPWQYKGDAFLVMALDAGTDPASVLFTHVPMWVQFRDIPFHLLTKKLARLLGEEVGTLIMIDNNSRGNMFEKFLRA